MEAAVWLPSVSLEEQVGTDAGGPQGPAALSPEALF